MKRSGFNRRPSGTCAACGRVKKLTAADKMPPHHPPNAPGKKCYETACAPCPPARPERKPRAAPIRARNPERAAQQRLEDFGPQGEWMRTLSCVTRCGARGPSEPSHVRSRGAGGTRDTLVPMCPDCHRKFHAGRETFAAAIGTTVEALVEVAAGYALRWVLLPESTRERYVREFRRRYPAAARLMP